MKMQTATGKVRALLTLAALVGLAVSAALLVDGSDAGADGAKVDSKRAAVERLLRRQDLGPGYFFLGMPNEGEPSPAITCDRLKPSDEEPKLASFLDRYSISGCFAIYARIFDAGDGRPAPHLIGTGAVDVGSVKGAAAFLRVAALTISHGFGDELPKVVPAPERVGDETKLFRVENFPVFGEEEAEASILAWRSGTSIGAIFAQAGSPKANDMEAVDFARLQQQHLEHPTPYTRAERYDAEAGFEDPSIAVPVYWLGRSFKPGGSLPAAGLEGAVAPNSRYKALPGEKLEIYYTHELSLGTWTAAGWQKFSATPRGRRLMGLPCTKTAKVRLAGGSATLYAAPRLKSKRCASNPPVHYFAVAELGGTMVAVNLESCPRCNTAAGGSDYNSMAGMKAVVKALRPR
jgi:NAD-dependent dihydropyrimidine dehydrogenase PreA subunit